MVIPFIQCMVGRRIQTRVRPPGDAWMEETPILTEDIPVGIVLEGVDIIGESLVKKKNARLGHVDVYMEVIGNLREKVAGSA